MKFKVGDAVRFLNEKGEGTVSRILNKSTVAVTISDGFEIPYLVEELVFSNLESAAEEKESAEKSKVNTVVDELLFEEEEIESVAPSTSFSKGVYIAFSPEQARDISKSAINAWFVNYTDYDVMFTFSSFVKSKFKTLESGKVPAKESLLVETIANKNLQDFSNFKVDVIFYNKKEHDYQRPISEVVKFKPIKLYRKNAFQHNPFIAEKALLIPVFEMGEKEKLQPLPKLDLEKILFQKKARASDAKVSKPHLKNDPNTEMEVDLHIEELLDDFSDMSNFEIIQTQLNHLRKRLDVAQNGNYFKMIVIHGVGNGRLKQEVQKVLTEEFKLRHYDASFDKYGFGATEVRIR